MKGNNTQVEQLLENLQAILAQELTNTQSQVRALLKLVESLPLGAADRRRQQLGERIKRLGERAQLLTAMIKEQLLERLHAANAHWRQNLRDSRLSRIINDLLIAMPASASDFCALLLDKLIEAIGAEQGLLVSYLRTSTEADIIAARNFSSRNLSLEEYSFSRSILHELFTRGRPILIEDACNNPVYAHEASVRKYQLRSIIAAPLLHRGGALGGLFFSNNSVAEAFTAEDLALILMTARFAAFYFEHARLLSVLFQMENPIFLDTSRPIREIIGEDRQIIQLLETIDKIADAPASVLIEGESGTGKELVARALHYRSRRHAAPFIAINCAAIPENLLESELFGYERGAFTGAQERHIGRFEQANGGTIFLDEINEMAYPLQAKLLRLLQSNEIQRLGSKETLKIDVRVVAASSRDLIELIKSGRFHEALYYRLKVIPLRIPPLRERKRDIPLLIDHFAQKFAAIYGKQVSISQEVYHLLQEYDFPGNVRELENLIHRLVALADDATISYGDLPNDILQLSRQRISLEKLPFYHLLHTVPENLADLQARRKELRRLLAEQEQAMIERVLRETDGNLTEAASRLGMHRITLHKIIRRRKM